MKIINSIHKYDVFVFTWLINARIHAALVKCCRYFSKTGDGQLYVALCFVLFWYSGAENPLLQTILLAFLIERPIYFILKNGFKRNRPPAALKNFHSSIIPSDQFSFPSGHTSAAFLIATLSAYFFPFIMPVLFIWASVIGFSRVVLGVHFPTDILMGIIVGTSTAIVSLNAILK